MCENLSLTRRVLENDQNPRHVYHARVEIESGEKISSMIAIYMKNYLFAVEYISNFNVIRARYERLACFYGG